MKTLNHWIDRADCAFDWFLNGPLWPVLAVFLLAAYIVTVTGG